MKQDNFIRDAIDESLSSVRFSERDARSVLRAVRNREEIPEHRPARRRRLQPVLAIAMTLVMIIPVGLFALRLSGTRPTAAPGIDHILPVSTPSASANPQSEFPADTDEINKAIQLARTCFESVCDTSIFSFEEYTVGTSCIQLDSRSREYTVTLTSIYGNGCSFSVTVAMPQAEVTHYTTPSLATVPAYIDSSQLKPAEGFSYSKLATWYTKYGPHLITWPQDAQAEFSRRYEGAMLRTAKEGELTADHAVTLAKELIAKHLPSQDKGIDLYGYAMLYSERAGADGIARYVVSVYPSAIEDTLPEPLGTVSFRPDGSDVVVTLN